MQSPLYNLSLAELEVRMQTLSRMRMCACVHIRERVRECASLCVYRIF